MIVSLQNRLILFLFVTSIGSALSGISAFLSVEHYFQSLIYLGFALSVRTLASAVFSYYANHVIEKLGFKLSLLVSQLFGCLALVVLYLGFYSNIFTVTLLGIILTGLPTTFVAILLSTILRVTAENGDLFRKYSGKRELVFGVALLLVAVLSPILLHFYSLNIVLLLDAISYVAGLILLMNVHIKSHPSVTDEKPVRINNVVATSTNAKEFLLKISTSMVLCGLLPLLASSGKISFTAHLPVLLRQSFWVIETIAAISASSLYLAFSVLRKHKWMDAILILNGVWLIGLIFANSIYSTVAIAAMICLLINLSYQKFRDDLIVSAGNDTGLIKAYSALSQLQRNVMMFLSPILISFLLRYTSTPGAVIIISFVQIVLLLIILTIGKKYRLFSAINFHSMNNK